jgi:carbamoyl-phosphate synthase small subunit
MNDSHKQAWSRWTDGPGVLVLETKSPEGSLLEYRGVLFGSAPASGFAWGEAVFNTSLTGYQEILTDPSYHRQLVCLTSSHIGNTGVNRMDEESAGPKAAGLILRHAPGNPSNWRSEQSLSTYLEQHELPGIHGVDTRALTRVLRDCGTVRALLLRESDRGKAASLFRSLPHLGARDLILEVTTREGYQVPSQGTKRFRVAALDFGIKRNLIHEITRLGCEVQVHPATTSASEILGSRPDGVFLSNGPGDPQLATYAVETVRELLGKVPVFGVCMGHQILGLALGARTYKLKFGHRGGNQPVRDLRTGHLEISSHNHGYAVDEASIPDTAEKTHINLNDGCVEGLRARPEPGRAPAFSVQYHPEAAPGPHDSKGLFSEFIRLMEDWQGTRKQGAAKTLA